MGGAPSPPALVQEARRRFGASYSIRWSSTESGGVGTGTAVDAPDSEALHTVGRPRLGIGVEVRDAAGARLPDAEVGELWIRSRATMSGYWGDPEASAAVLDDGWLRTGDLGAIDATGCVTLHGRLGEMYIRGGYNVFPSEVVSALLSHPGVAEVAVVPRADPVLGEVGVAVVVPTDPGRPPALDDLRTHAGGTLARHKLPEHLVVVPDLPLTAMQKLDRSALRRLVDD
jgi:acyl-CoA synthetase (AMP-forming)/AMP-acid ligase II